jgi:hypothetical protein
MGGIANKNFSADIRWQLQTHFERVAYQRKKAEQPHPDAPRPHDPSKFMPRPDFIAVMDTKGVAFLMPYDNVGAALSAGKVKILRHPNNYNELFGEDQLVDIPENVLPERRISLNESFNYPNF